MRGPISLLTCLRYQVKRHYELYDANERTMQNYIEADASLQSDFDSSQNLAREIQELIESTTASTKRYFREVSHEIFSKEEPLMKEKAHH